MLHQIHNVAGRVVIDIVLRHDVPIAHLMVQTIISNIDSLLVRKLVIFHAVFGYMLVGLVFGILSLVMDVLFLN